MSAIYDNWERLVDAVLKKQQLWELFHARSPSVLSGASSDLSSSISNLSSRIHDYNFEFSGAGSSSRSVPKLVLVSNFTTAFDVEDVFLASAELLGRGTFGSVYTASMENGVKIVVRRLNSCSVSEQDFKRCMKFVGDVRHENVVALRAYYSSKDERLMLYDYYSESSVFEFLHGQTGENRAHVDWKTRMKIAIGAARGIAEIHSQIGGTLVHGNIKSSNTLIKSQHDGCVSDFGLASMIETTFMPTARCYAPEVKNTQNVSQASDVYSFGILLVELLTRKSSTHVPGGPEAVDLVKLVTSVKSKERAAKVFDADLLNHPTISDEMVKVLKIGMRCIEKSIKKRPKMSQVVKMLEDISIASKDKELIFFDDANPTFDLDYMLKAPSWVLAKGMFGNSYKVELENGNTIVVKTLRDVIVTLKDFQHYAEVIGRMTHENLTGVRAYHFSTHDKLLVCDYYDQNSLYALLHDKLDIVSPALDWESRLKIAVGAAKGVAHIHAQDGGKFVHGNIKSSKIFLNGQKYGIVADFGIAKFMRPVRLSETRSWCYTSPEVTDTGSVSQASDVYSFGVVLLELVSGQPPQHTTDDDEIVSLVKWIQSVVRDEWTAQVFDVELMRYRDDHEDAMVQFLQIGMDCVSIAPERRPRMSELVKMLEELSGIESPNEPRFEDAWDKPSMESRLEYLMDDLLPTLRP